MHIKCETNGIILASASAFAWGTAMVMSKAALSAFPPIQLLAVQLAASCVALWGWIALSTGARGGLARAFRFSWLGLLEPGAAYFLGLTGLADIEAGVAGLIQSSESLMIAALAAIIMGERLPRRFILLAALAFAGIVVATMPPSGDAIGQSLSGDALVLAGTGFAALYVILSARYAGSIDPVRLVAWQHLVALLLVLVSLPFAGSGEGMASLRQIPLSVWVLAALSGVVQYALAFSLYLAAMQRVSAGVAGAFINLIPVVGIAGGALFLDESPSSLELVGAATTIAALVLLAQRSGGERPRILASD